MANKDSIHMIHQQEEGHKQRFSNVPFSIAPQLIHMYTIVMVALFVAAAIALVVQPVINLAPVFGSHERLTVAKLFAIDRPGPPAIVALVMTIVQIIFLAVASLSACWFWARWWDQFKSSDHRTLSGATFAIVFVLLSQSVVTVAVVQISRWTVRSLMDLSDYDSQIVTHPAYSTVTLLCIAAAVFSAIICCIGFGAGAAAQATRGNNLDSNSPNQKSIQEQSLDSRLRKLKELQVSGLITEHEYEQKRQRMLSEL